MLQIIVAAAGLLALLAGKLKVTRTKELRANRARAIGLLLWLVAALPLLAVWPKEELGIAAMSGACLFVGFLAMMLATPRVDGVEDNDSRWRRRDDEPILVGGMCTSCDLKIVSVARAATCPECGVPLHSVCVADHLAKAHAPVAQTAAG